MGIDRYGRQVKDQNDDVNLKGKITYTVEFMEGSALAVRIPDEPFRRRQWTLMPT